MRPTDKLRRRDRSSYRPADAWFLAALAALALACGENPGSEQPRPADARVYSLRGHVQRVEPTTLLLRHEALDDLVDAAGEVVGMDAMTMSFPVAESVSLEGVSAGTVVRVDLEIDWSRGSPARIVGLERLPDDTVLEFRAARPAP